MIGFIIFLLVIGFAAGFLARLLVPGPDPMSLLQPGSMIGAIIALVVHRAARPRRQPATF